MNEYPLVKTAQKQDIQLFLSISQIMACRSVSVKCFPFF